MAKKGILVQFHINFLPSSRHISILIWILLFVAVDDATGHYTSGFYYGNNYWMGSLSLCRTIIRQTVIADRNKTFAEEERRNVGLPFSKVHTQTYRRIYNEKPPFNPSFFVIKMLLNETYPTAVVSFNGEPCVYVRMWQTHLLSSPF